VAVVPKIEKLFAFIVADANADDEGVAAALNIYGPMPMVGADLARVETLMPQAEEIARRYGKTVEVREFSNMRTIRVIRPGGTH
jgi:hypothetical protein